VTLAENPAVRLPVGLTTGIGCLPHVDPGEAVEFVLRHTPALPAAPSLPARSRRESMVAQAATGIAGVVVNDDGSLDLDHARLDPEAPLVPGFDTDAYTGLRAFLTAVVDRTGPVKLSLTGPVTLGVALHAAGIDEDLAFRIAGRVVRQRARALTDLVLQRVPQAQLVIFVDEPGLVRLTEPGFPIGPNDGIDLVSGALAALEPLAITGLHCCGPADWRLALAAGPRILSLPVGAGAVRHAGVIGDFLDDGGWLAWGAVPVDGPVGPTVDRLWRRLSDEFCELADGGCDPAHLRTHAMVTPVCGLPHHGITQAEQVMVLANGVASRLHDQAIGLRLSVGA
jgi:hypothetical protein